MAGERQSAVASVAARVQGAVSSELREAALVRWAPSSEAFVWRARRCIEALLYALLLEQGADVAALAEQSKTADELLRHEKLKGLAWPREVRDHLESVRKYGNTASHFQADGAVSATTASIVATALHEVVRWYLARGGRVSPDDETSLRGLHDERQRVLTRAEQALHAEKQRVTKLEDAMRGARLPVGEPAVQRVGMPVWAGASLALVALAAGYAVGVSRDHAAPVAAVVENDRVTMRAPAPVETATPTAPIAPTAPSVPTERRDASTETAVPVPVPTAMPGRWRVCRGASDAHCVEPDLVTTANYRRCVEGRRCTRPTCPSGEGSNWAQGSPGNGLPINCVSQSQAEVYCEQRGHALASVAALTEARAGLHRTPDTDEWTDRGIARLEGGVQVLRAVAPPSRAVGFRCMRP